MKKRIFLCLCMVALLLCIFALSVSADDLVGANNDTYGTVSTIDSLKAIPEVLDTASRVIIKGADGKYYTFPSYYVLTDSTTLTWRLPDEIKTALGLTYTTAKDVRLSIVRMEIPKGITTVGNYAFEKSTTLLEVYFPSSVESLGNGVFKQCTNLVKASLIDTKITVIKGGTIHTTDSVFRGLTNLTTVSLPSTLETIEGWGFCGCTSLSNINIENTSVKTIGDYAFEKAGVVNVYLPDTLTTMGTGIFNCSTTLTTLRLSSNLTTIGSKMCNSCSALTTVTNMENTKLTSIPSETFRTCRKLTTNFVVPNTVESIGQYGFADIAAVHLSFGSNVSTITSGAFAGCSSLKLVFVTSSDETYINNFKSATSMSGVVAYETYIQNTSQNASGKYVVSGCDICATLYGGNHQLDPAKSNPCAGICSNCLKAQLSANPVHNYVTSIAYANYLANGVKTMTCQNEGCAHKTTPVVSSVDPIISDFKGFSVNNDGDAITFGYVIDYDALDEFVKITGKSVELGFVTAVKAFANGDAYTSDKSVKATVVTWTTSDEENEEAVKYAGADFILRGNWDRNVTIGEETVDIKDVEFYMAGYLVTNGTVAYLNAGGSAVTADTVTFKDCDVPETAE